VNRIALLLTLLLICGGLLLPMAQAEEPVVRAVLFWSTTCPHCHVVINETLPPLQAKYGEQWQIELIQTSDPAGYELYRAAVEVYSVSPDRQGVPLGGFCGDSQNSAGTDRGIPGCRWGGLSRHSRPDQAGTHNRNTGQPHAATYPNYQGLPRL